MNLSDVFYLSNEDDFPDRRITYTTRTRGPATKRPDKVDPRDKRFIVWDGEGMKLSGGDKPQHYVLFGCSADKDNPLIINEPDGDLSTTEIIDYACGIAQRFPNCFHVGYFFKYDQNMIIKSLPVPMKLALYQKNCIRWTANDVTYGIKWTPGKQTRLSRKAKGEKPVSLTIDDIATFFARSFVAAYEGLCPENVKDASWQVVVQGKMERAASLYEDLPSVLHYWQSEIVYLERLCERFRTIMYDGGFILRDWYGPGALANFIRKREKTTEHELGGKQSELPADVHEASKTAYFGGHVEQYMAGRIDGPVYVYDINSAYPAGIAQLPTMRTGGHWRHVEQPTPDTRMGVYHLRYDNGSLLAARPQPLPHRDDRANITYPGIVEGWYWTAEAQAAVTLHGADLLEGWEWQPMDDYLPWHFFNEMYDRRRELKAAGNPTEMAFKLGLNSMYGKMAQRAGWDTEKNLPPLAHTLPMAGWVTAYCRADILWLMARMDSSKIIAVETDAVFSLQSPTELQLELSKNMGDWDCTIYDEMIYIQSGLYLARKDEEWIKVRSRGMDASSLTYASVMAYLAELKAGKPWHPIVMPQKERFIGLGAALSRSRSSKGINPFKVNAQHCRWTEHQRDFGPGLTGKRIHIPELCRACDLGDSAADSAHQLVVRSRAAGNPLSAPYSLPWEPNHIEEYWRELAREEEDLITS